ncbi:MAG: SH3 domain-containing protein [Leptospiraceae bacterium]|nr:SH3 domain-containing protein [Leptospiraceae bacterium]MDW7976971.1 SH3 domain-containing protein [Leptospiraceae bacterium]
MVIHTPPKNQNEKSKKINFALSLFFFFLGYLSIFAEEKEKYVIRNFAILRTNPSTYAFEVSILKFGEKVEVIKKTPTPTRIGSVEDYWYFVKTQRGYLGWVFGAFLGNTLTQQNITVDTKKIEEILLGVWWEVDDKDQTRFRSIEFLLEDDKSPEQKSKKFIYKNHGKKLKEGRFEVLNTGEIQFHPVLPIGDVATLYEVLNDYRMVLRKNEKEVYFKKAKTNIIEANQNN